MLQSELPALDKADLAPATGESATAVESTPPVVDSAVAMPSHVVPTDTRPDVCQSLAFVQIERQIGFPGTGHQLELPTDALYGSFERDTVRAANVELQDWAPRAATRDDFVNAIAAHAEKNQASLQSNRRALQSRISSYRATCP